jgi:hypothetical protein
VWGGVPGTTSLSITVEVRPDSLRGHSGGIRATRFFGTGGSARKGAIKEPRGSPASITGRFFNIYRVKRTSENNMANNNDGVLTRAPIPPMKKGQRSCILDTERNVLACKEPGGSWKQYDVAGSLISAESKQIKEKNLDDLVSAWQRCRDAGKCSDPVRLRVFKIDSCPACQAHGRSMDHVVNAVSKAGIPLTIEERDARDHISDFKRLRCNGTPCVSMAVGSGRERKIYEGNKGEIGIVSAIMGVRNPLYYKMDLSKEIPKNLTRRIG